MSEEVTQLPGEPPVVPPPLTADEQDAKFVEINRPMLDAFSALDERQKVLVLVRYITYYGSLPALPEDVVMAEPPVERTTEAYNASSTT